MKKSECKDSLEIYKKFLTRVTKIAEFMKIAEVRPEEEIFKVKYVSRISIHFTHYCVSVAASRSG